jgi:hypothetical protein
MRLNLLPSYFKFIGLMLILAGIISQIIFNLQNVEIVNTWRMKSFELAFIISSLLILISKTKNEDEMSEAVRHSSIAYGFVTTLVLYLITSSHVLEYIGLSPTPMDAFGFIISVMLFSIGVFYMIRYNMVKREK